MNTPTTDFWWQHPDGLSHWPHHDNPVRTRCRRPSADMVKVTEPPLVPCEACMYLLDGDREGKRYP